MNKIAMMSIILLVILLSACSKNHISELTTEKESAILIPKEEIKADGIVDNALPPTIHYNNSNYQMYDSVQGVEIEKLELVGKITSTVDLSQMPTNNFETNCKYMGLDIYSYMKDVLLIEYPDDSYNLFKKVK